MIWIVAAIRIARPPVTRSRIGRYLLTNEDDCSVPVDSDLFATDQYDLESAYGPLKSYRCNEFGPLCTYPDGHLAAPPRLLPDGDVTMMSCSSAPDMGQGKLTKVGDFVDFLRALKRDPRRIVVAAIASPDTPYVVTSSDFVVPDPTMPDPPRHEMWPSVEHACMNSDGSFGDPAPRLAMLLRAFTGSEVGGSICASTYAPTMTELASTVGRAMVGTCP